MDRKQRVTLKFLENVSIDYLEIKDFIEDNMKAVCKRANLTLEEVIYFVTFV